MITEKKPVNYLNNKDILKEIHASKNSYCTFSQPEYHQYDIIIDQEGSLLNGLEFSCREDVIQKAKENRAARLSTETQEKIAPESIATTDLIFRIMTWDHIPISPKPQKKQPKKKSAKDFFEFDEESLAEPLFEEDQIDPEIDDMIHVRVNFPPFQHFKFDENNNLACIGKSHWKGDLTTGEFSKDHGQLTKKLAKMYLMLCDKYALRFNWRDRKSVV